MPASGGTTKLRYRAIRDAIRHDIDGRRFAPGERLPSDAELEAAMRHDAMRAQSVARANAAAHVAQPRHHIPPLRNDIEVKSDRFRDRTISYAATILLREVSEPLHVNEIYNRLLEGGFVFTGNNPTISIAVSLNRNGRFRKVAPGTFDLVMRDASQAS